MTQAEPVYQVTKLSVLSVSLSVCTYVCQTITFESLNVGCSYSDIRYISKDYRPSSYGVKVKVTEAKKVENTHPAMLNFYPQ